MRDYTRIAAPFSGVVTAKSVEPGNLAAPGVPLLTIKREGAYRLETSVDESKLPFIKAGQNVEIALEALDRHLNARVSEIVPAVDAASRACIGEIDLPALPNVRSRACVVSSGIEKGAGRSLFRRRRARPASIRLRD
jgi:multidrug efflux pump subunit AcrA (membrane-fusion protein)